MPQFTDIALFNYFKWRQKRIENVYNHPEKFQKAILKQILKTNSKTVYGKLHGFEKLNGYKDFKHVPMVSYEDIFLLIKRMIDGENNVLTKDKIKWFAKSSGTSNDRSKYIPVSKKYLQRGHLKCAWDAASFIYDEDPEAKLFADRSLIMGGSIEKLSETKMAGDISGVIIHHFPKIGRRFYTPDIETALMSNWDEKINRIAEITSKQNVTLLAGVPTWTIVLLNKILEITGKDNISEVWPNLRSFLHGGVGFEPYRETFKKLIPSDRVALREVYNASEGYFALQNHQAEDGMLLLCDHQIFFEFIPVEDINSVSPECLPLHHVELGQKYAMVITNTSGLYRYRIGDVVKFVSVHPFKIKVVGREKEMINVFGEEVSVLNTDNALADVCKALNVVVKEYTVGPIFMTDRNKGGHEWAIEFEKKPANISIFEIELDKRIRQINSDYDAKRSHDLALLNLKVHVLKPNSFESWLRSKGKYGGQNKVPRLRNDRYVLDQLIP